MAAPTGSADFSSVSSALATLFQPRVRAQMNRTNVGMQLIPYEPGEGKNLQWDVEFGTGSPAAGASVLADGTDVTTYNDDSIIPATLQWGTYSEAFAVTGKAMAAAAVTRNPLDLENLFGEKFERAVRRLTKAINVDLYSGDGSTDEMAGLLGGSAPPLGLTGTYATIVRSDHAQWASNVSAAAGVLRPLSFRLMRDMRQTIYTACGEMPNLILCSPTMHEEYGMLFKDQRRYVSEININGTITKLDGGYKALEFDGIPIVQDVDVPANKFLWLNTNYVKLRQLPDSPSQANRAPGMVQLHAQGEEQLGGNGGTRLYARINPLAVTGDAFKVQLVMYPQFQSERNNALGLLSDIAVTN